MKKFWSDCPHVIDIGSAVLVVLWLTGVLILDWWSPAAYLRNVEVSETFSSVALGLSSAAAMAAGLAGVVIVFALSTNSRAFRRMRAQATGKLRLSLLWPTCAAFASAGVSLVAALLASGPDASWAFWPAAIASFWLVHAVIRFLWLLDSLAQIVLGDDKRAAQEENRLDSRKLLGLPPVEPIPHERTHDAMPN